MTIKVSVLATILTAVSIASMAQIGTPGPGVTGLNRLGPYNGLTGAALDKGLLDEDFTVRLERQTAFNKKYLYPQFVTGKVFMKGKLAGGLKVNYHKLFGELVFINAKGDTLIVNDNPGIEFIQTPQNLFYHHKKEGFFELLSPQDASVWLLKRTTLKIVKTENVSQNDSRVVRSFARDTVKYYHVLYRHRDVSKMLLDVSFEDLNQYFLSDADRDLSRATRINFLKAFSGHKDQIKAWMDENNIDLDSERDIVKLYEYCVSLK